MKEKKFRDQVKYIYHLLILVFSLIILIVLGTFLYVNNKNNSLPNVKTSKFIVDTTNEIKNGIHVRTGLIEGEGLMEVVRNCTSCHSAKLITQNRMNKDMWLGTIKWMQESQNLHDLKENKSIIVNYLIKYYSPEEKGRRNRLTNVNWYELKE